MVRERERETFVERENKFEKCIKLIGFELSSVEDTKLDPESILSTKSSPEKTTFAPTTFLWRYFNRD